MIWTWHCFYWIWASCMKYNKDELYNTKQDTRNILKVPSPQKKKIRNFSSQDAKITLCAWIVKKYTDPTFFLNGEWTNFSHWCWWIHFEWGIWSKNITYNSSKLYMHKTYLHTKKSSKHADAVIGQVLEQILNLLSDFSLENFSLQNGFAEVFIARFWWKLKLRCVVPSPNWTELLGFQSHLWYLWGFGGLLFLLYWTILLDQVTQGVFLWGSFPQERQSDYETQALGKSKQAKPTTQVWESVQRP